MLSGIYYFNVENYSGLGQANYCKVNSSIDDERLFRACANDHYRVNSVSCLAVYTENENYAINVHDKFNIVLLLIFIGFGFGIINGIVAAIGCTGLAKILALPQLANLAGFIMLHIYRFKASGQFCSGHYNPDNWNDAPLKSKGSFLLGFMITAWASLACCCCLVFLIVCNKRD